MTTIRVVLADDHILVRGGIRTLLEEIGGVEVVGEADDGYAVLSLVERHRPQVVLLDIGMPGMSGLEAVPRLLQIDPTVCVVMLSMHKGEEYVLAALRAGAHGYLLKDAAIPELELAIHAVARGETYLSPAVSRTVVNDYLRRAGAIADAVAALTPRQREILRLVAIGGTSKEIASRLGVSYRTVEAHRMNLMRRINVRDTAGLVRYALKAGLITASEK
ncbi:MAG TPA: response regulator transcription factor [Thermoanaerobaculia bacterium]|nr:response regulator transcription factor [Thermoanaerobaculia bacterium]